MPVAEQRTSYRRFKGSIPPNGGVLDIDSIPFETFLSANYLITYHSETENKYLTYELTCARESDDVSDEIYSKQGNPISVSANVLKIASDVILRLVNNESFQVDVSIHRFKI